MSDHELGEKINELFDRDEYAEAERLIRDRLASPFGLGEIVHWWHCRLSSAVYEQRRYEEALFFAELAEKIHPECPLARWDKAGALWMLNREDEAAALWMSIIADSKDAVGEKCWEGVRWTEDLARDCKERLSEYLCQNRDS